MEIHEFRQSYRSLNSPVNEKIVSPMIRALSIALATALLVMFTGCDSCRTPDPGDGPPRPYVSTSAPYSLEVPTTWTREPDGAINPDADFSASFEDRLFFMVIPQALPTFPRPDVDALKREALQVLEQAVDDLTVERRGSIELDGVSGRSVYALGTLGDQSVRYVTAYAVYDDFGFQIIAFSEAQHEELLLSEVDSLLSTWRFGTPQEATAPGTP